MTHPSKRILVVVFTLIFTATNASASEETRRKLARLAEVALKSLSTKGAKTIDVGNFTPKTDLLKRLAINPGPGVEELLRQELNNLEPGVVNEDAFWVLNGDISFVGTGTGKLFTVQIDAKLVQRDTKERLQFLPAVVDLPDVTIEGNRAISALVQQQGVLPVAERGKPATRQQRNEQIRENLKAPPLCLQGTRIKNSKGSPFAVEILKLPLAQFGKRKAQATLPTACKNRAFVELGVNDLYEIRVFNAGGDEIAVAVSIDGIDVFHFSRDRAIETQPGDPPQPKFVTLGGEESLKGRPRFSHFIMRQDTQKQLTIEGWHQSVTGKRNFRSFLVTTYGKGAVSKADRKARGDIGVIQVRFFRCRPLIDGVPRGAGSETGFGPDRAVPTQVVQYEIEEELESIIVRYNRPSKK